MASLLKRVSDFARSRQGRELVEKAKRAAADPENRRKLEEFRRRAGRRGGEGRRY